MNDFEKQLKKAATQQSASPLERRVWLGVKDQLTMHKRRRLRRRIIIWSAAACILLLVGVGASFFGTKVDPNQLVLEQYGLEEYNFPKQVETQLIALKGSRIPESQVERFDALKSQLYFLDQQYQNYLTYIEENGYQEYIGRQIQHYYEVKIELLEKIQKEIQKLKTKNDENNIDNNSDVEWQI